MLPINDAISVPIITLRPLSYAPTEHAITTVTDILALNIPAIINCLANPTVILSINHITKLVFRITTAKDLFRRAQEISNTSICYSRVWIFTTIGSYRYDGLHHPWVNRPHRLLKRIIHATAHSFISRPEMMINHSGIARMRQTCCQWIMTVYLVICYIGYLKPCSKLKKSVSPLRCTAKISMAWTFFSLFKFGKWPPGLIHIAAQNQHYRTIWSVFYWWFELAKVRLQPMIEYFTYVLISIIGYSLGVT